MPFSDNTFDLVFSQGFVEHFQEPKDIVAEHVRVAKKGGIVLIDVPQAFSPQAVLKSIAQMCHAWPLGWERNYTEGQMKRLMEDCGLEVIDSYAWGLKANLKMGLLSNVKKLIRGNRNSQQLLQSEPTIPPASSRVSELSERAWWLQQTWLARHSLNCIGVIGQKV